jgi:hypothetical protein
VSAAEAAVKAHAANRAAADKFAANVLPIVRAIQASGQISPGFVRLLAGGDRRIDRRDKPRQIRHRFPHWPAHFFEQPARPQCARYIIEDLGLDLLPP